MIVSTDQDLRTNPSQVSRGKPMTEKEIFDFAHRKSLSFSNIHDREDVAQEMVISMFKASEKADPSRYPRTYVQRAGYHGLFNWMSSWLSPHKKCSMSLNTKVTQKDDSEEYIDMIESRDAPPGDECCSIERSQIIKRQINLLRENYQRVIRMRFFEGMTHPEIARIMKVSPQRIEKIEKTALQKMEFGLRKVGRFVS